LDALLGLEIDERDRQQNTDDQAREGSQPMRAVARPFE
jgi:hypothetical protein